MKKRTLKIGAVGILLASGLCAQDLAGSWQGTLKGGSKDRRAVIEITKSETGEWKAVVHTDQTTEVLAADSVALDRSHIKIAIDPLDSKPPLNTFQIQIQAVLALGIRRDHPAKD